MSTEERNTNFSEDIFPKIKSFLEINNDKEYGSLIEGTMEDGSKIKFLRKTIYIAEHKVPVPNHINTAKQAVYWIFGYDLPWRRMGKD